MQVVSQARRLSRALKSPILLNSDRFLAPDFRFLESPLTSLQCPNHHSFSSLSPCFSGTSTFVCFFVFCLVTEKVVVKMKHGNEFEIVENKEQTKSCIETLGFFFFFFLMILLALNVNLFLHLFFVIFCLVTEKVVEKRKHRNEFEFAEKGTEKA